MLFVYKNGNVDDLMTQSIRQWEREGVSGSLRDDKISNQMELNYKRWQFDMVPELTDRMDRTNKLLD